MWKDVVGYEGYYQVSDDGQVKGVTRSYVDKKGVTQTIKERMRALVFNKQGYAQIQLTISGVTKGFMVHRLVGYAFIDNPENKPFINHKDGNKANNTIANLEWCTRSENELHAYRTGLKKMSIDGRRRVSLANRKDLTGLIETVTALSAEGLSHPKIAKLVGYSRQYVQLLLAGKRGVYT